MSLNPFKHIIGVRNIHLAFLYVLVSFFISSTAFSQVKNEDELKKQANTLFEAEDYNASYKLYSQLVSLYPKDPEYNYRLGVCMLFTEPDKKKPFTYFQIALKNPAEAPKDAKFYLAKTYHVNYKFDDAIKLYNEYKQTAGAASVKRLQVDREIAACRNGKRLLSNLSDLVVISKKQLNEADYFRSYDIKDIGGKLLVKPEDFKTGADKKKKDNSVVYLPRSGERVYYSSYGDNGSNGRDIYFVNRLPNGSWSKPQPMPAPVNTEYDDDYPFLHPNGRTLYFSSKGHNSMGGYDVFKTTYDPETQSWSKPENMEFPINSPDDDILFVTDSLEKTAFFSTGRYSPYGKIDVLKINTERRPMNFAVLKGTVVKEDVAQSLLSKITVKDMSNGAIVGTYQAKENGDYYMELPNGGKFIFTVETPGLTTQSDGVQMPLAYSLKPYKQVISYEQKVLKIINYFDGQIADENYSMMIDLIEKKAKLEVNENDPYNSGLKTSSPNTNATAAKTNTTSAVSTTNPTAQGDNTTSAKNSSNNTNKNVTNEQLLAIAKTDAIEADNESKNLKQEAQDAFDLATQKTAEAVSLQKQVDEATTNLNSITDIAKKNEETIKINQLKEDAKMATNIATTATELAKKLEMDANQKKQEAELTNQYIKELEAITKNKNNKEALAKLEQIQKQLDDLSKQKNQSDELISSIKAELELKQNELKKTENKNNEILKEISLLKDESKNLESDLTNETDKSLKENINAQIRELNNDIDAKNKELTNNNQKIASLQSQVDGLNQELTISSKILNEDNNSTVAVNTSNANNKSGTGNTTAIDNNQNTSAENNSLSYEGITKKYDTQVSSKKIDTSSKEELGAQNQILKDYNKEINELVALDKNQLSKTKNDAEKKKLNVEIKELEKQKAKNDQLMASNSNALKKLDSQPIASNTTTAGNTTATTTLAANGGDETASSNTTAATTAGDPGNTAATNTLSSGNAPGNQGGAGIQPINTSASADNSAYLNNLNKLKNGLSANSGQATANFDYNNYQEAGSLALKQTADKKFEAARQNESNLNALIAKTESDLKANSGGKADVLVNEAEALNNKAFEQRKESAGKSGEEKNALIAQALENEKLAVDKKLQASDIQKKNNQNSFDSNTRTLAELQKLSASKTSNDISQANLLADEAAINFSQAQKIRDESNAYPSGAARLGGLGNAEEKESEALAKQQKAIQLLAKANPSYNVKPDSPGSDPGAAIANVNNEINKTAQTQIDAYSALSKANQNELKLKSDKLSKNPALKQNTTATGLKNEADKLNKDANAFNAQASKAATPSEKAELLLKANDNEIAALKKLNEASDLLANSGNAIAVNTNTSTSSTDNNTTANNRTATTTSATPVNTTTATIAATNTTNPGNTNASETNTTSTTANNTSGTNPSTDTNSGNTAANNRTASNNQNSTATPTTTGTANAAAVANTTSQEEPGNTISSTTVTPQSTDVNADVAKLKSGLNNPAESTLTNFNTYTNTEAISLKEKAAEKINAALNEDKNISASLDNVKQIASSSPSQSLSQENINSSIAEAEQMNDQAYELRKGSVSKSAEEKEKDLQQARDLESKAIARKIEAADKQKQLNAATFDANNQSLSELADMAKGKNIGELSTAGMQMDEAILYFNQGKKLREETNAYPTDAAKLGGLSNAEEKETWALSKQKALLDTYKKYFSNYTPKVVNASTQSPQAVAKLNETRATLNMNNQLHSDGLLLLSQAIEKEYKDRLAALPANLKGNNLALKTKAQELYKKYQSQLAQANQAKDAATKKELLINANKNGQDAISLLNQVTAAGNAVTTNNASQNNNNSAANTTATATSTAANSGNANRNNTTTSGNNTTANTNAGNASSTANNTGNANRNNSNNTGNAGNTAPVVKLNVEGLEVKTNNAYSDNNPIPLDEKIPDGLVFKVQIGAFKNALPNTTFKGLSPVIAQSTPNGYIRYMAGNFEKYESANAVKNDLKNLGYNDAFVVAYFNGKRINLNEGVDKARESGQKVELSANTSAGITAGANVPRNSAPPVANTTGNTADSQPAEITNELEKMNGLLYTVQIGVYSKQVTRAQLSNLRPIYTEKLPSGLYRYTAGIYNQSSKLLEDKRKVVELGVKDAFVSAYYNAKRIPFAEGQKLQAENNNLKMETENPIIFPGTTAPPANTAATNTAAPANTTATANPPANTSVPVFNNGVTQGPAATADNGVKTDEAGISFKVQIGAYKNQVPNDVASRFMNIKTWPVNNIMINGLYIYSIGNFNAPAFAQKLKDEAVALGITDAFVTVYKDGKKLYGAEALQYLNK